MDSQTVNVVKGWADKGRYANITSKIHMAEGDAPYLRMFALMRELRTASNSVFPVCMF